MDSKVQNKSIIFFTRSLEVGGAERQIVELSNGLVDHMKVTVLTMYPLVPLADGLSPKVRLIQLDKKSRWDLLGFFSSFVKEIKSEAPTYFYSFLVIPNILSLLVKIFSKKTKLIWSIRAANMNLSMYDLFSKVTFNAQIMLSPFSDLVISNSMSALEYHRKMGFKSKKEVVIANGINLDNFYKVCPDEFRDQYQLKSEKFTIGIVGRLDPVKDHPLFFRILKEYVQVDDKLQILIVGNGSNDYCKYLRDLVIVHNLNHICVWVSNCLDMKAAYSSIDLLLLTSQSESFPNVLIEAMSCETRVLTKNVGDAQSIVGENRFICDSDSPEDWVKAICELRDQGVDEKLLRKRVSSCFSNEIMIEKTIQAL